jgi:protoporphyrinogen oxidase
MPSPAQVKITPQPILQFGESEPRVVMIGAGPAGLTAAYELCKSGVQAVVLDKDQKVGGISKTVEYKGYRFDIGGHRFFTKVKEVEDMWREVLFEADFLHCKRLSRIYYNKRFFYYPLRAFDALFGLGIWNSTLILLSYFYAQVFPEQPEETFEQWVSNRFGKRLFNVFFRTYTEKVWGIPCDQISAEWAGQRIKGLSLLAALKNAMLKQNVRKDAVITTLVDAFDYPRLGPGMMWTSVADIVRDRGGEVQLGAEVKGIIWKPGRVTGVRIGTDSGEKIVTGTDFISTMPIRELIQRLEPAAPASVLAAASKLNYRDFLTVALIVDRPDVFPDNWIYIHDPDVKMGRIQNFKNWSAEMVPDQSKTCLGLEYFCFEGDGLWTMPDAELIELGKQELEKLGMAKPGEIEDGTVVRMPKAYPVYDATYNAALDTTKEFLAGLVNLQLVGRNGMHKYNNQDHSMLTAMLAVKNILGAHYDLWQVNAEQEYHEEINANEAGKSQDYAVLASTQPRVPQRTGVGVVR